MSDMRKLLIEARSLLKYFEYEPWRNKIDQECGELVSRIDAALAEPEQEPVAWIRFCSDNTYEGPIMNHCMEQVRKKSGAWTPLYTKPDTQ